MRSLGLSPWDIETLPFSDKEATLLLMTSAKCIRDSGIGASANQTQRFK